LGEKIITKILPSGVAHIAEYAVAKCQSVPLSVRHILVLCQSG